MTVVVESTAIANSLFDQIERECRRKKALAAKLAAAAGEGGSVPLCKPGQTALAGPDMSKPGACRLTRFDDQGPIGHAEFSSLAEAIYYAILQGGFRAAE